MLTGRLWCFKHMVWHVSWNIECHQITYLVPSKNNGGGLWIIEVFFVKNTNLFVLLCKLSTVTHYKDNVWPLNPRECWSMHVTPMPAIRSYWHSDHMYTSTKVRDKTPPGASVTSMLWPVTCMLTSCFVGSIQTYTPHKSDN